MHLIIQKDKQQWNVWLHYQRQNKENENEKIKKNHAFLSTCITHYKN